VLNINLENACPCKLPRGRNAKKYSNTSDKSDVGDFENPRKLSNKYTEVALHIQCNFKTPLKFKTSSVTQNKN
jgi:hypothetical protein